MRLAFESDTVFDEGRRLGLKHTSFEEAQRLLGAAKLDGHGEAGDLLRWICYRLNGLPRMSLLLEGDEMSSEWLGGFELVPAGSRPKLERHCIALNIAATTIETNSGVHLGLTRSELQRVLNMRGRDSAGVVVFARTIERHYKNSDGASVPYDESSSLLVWFRNGRVIRFGGWRVDAS